MITKEIFHQMRGAAERQLAAPNAPNVTPHSQWQYDALVDTAVVAKRLASRTHLGDKTELARTLDAYSPNRSTTANYGKEIVQHAARSVRSASSNAEGGVIESVFSAVNDLMRQFASVAAGPTPPQPAPGLGM